MSSTCGLKWIIGFGFVNVFSNCLTIITPLKRTGPSFEKKIFSTKNDLYQFGRIWHSGSKGRLFNLIIPIFNTYYIVCLWGWFDPLFEEKVNLLHWLISLIVFWVFHNNYLPLVHWFCRRSCLNLVVTVALFYYGDIISLEELMTWTFIGKKKQPWISFIFFRPVWSILPQYLWRKSRK